MTPQEVLEVTISKLAIDPDVQPRIEGIDPDHVRVLQEDPDRWEPITVVRVDGELRPVDFAHRLAAAQNLGLTTIRVRVVEAPTDGDLRGMAFDLNAVHGKALTLRDRIAFGEYLLRRKPRTSNMKVSKRAGLSPTTIQRIRERLEEQAAIDPTDREVNRGGVTYSYPGSTRKAGELPAEGFGEQVGRLFSSADRREQRRVASFLRRVAEAMEDGARLLDEPESSAEAASLVLGEDEATSLGARLVAAGAPIVKVGRALVAEPE